MIKIPHLKTSAQEYKVSGDLKYTYLDRLIGNTSLRCIKQRTDSYDLGKIYPNQALRTRNIIFWIIKIIIFDNFINYLLKNKIQLFIFIALLVISNYFFFYLIYKKLSWFVIVIDILLLICFFLWFKTSSSSRKKVAILINLLLQLLVFFNACRFLLKILEIKDPVYDKIEDLIIEKKEYQKAEYGIELQKILSKCFVKDGIYNASKIKLPKRNSKFYQFTKKIINCIK